MTRRERPLVVIADDEPDIRELVSYRLQQEGFDVASAADGEQALEMVRDLHPDLLVVDLVMPNVDGYEVTEEIRGDPDIEATPVLMLSARVVEIDLQRAAEAGVDEYLTKPFSAEELRTKVRALKPRD